MAKKQVRNQSGMSAENVDGNVDKIREILFGGQMRDYEQRFADLESRLGKNIELLAASIEKRIERLDAFARRELDKLSDQLKDERKARREEGRRGGKEMKELAGEIASRCAELEELIGGEAEELRGLLQDQGEELTGVIGETHAELSKNLATETRSVAEGTVGRDDLATLLTEVATRLKKDAKPRGG